MDTIPSIDEAEIRERVGAQSFQRGRAYATQGAIFGARRQGSTLKASCTGSYGNAYRLHVTFDDEDIAEAQCSCPVGEGGYCKHIAALLLTWLANPAQFSALEETETALERRSKEELVALVKQMLRRHPDLEVLLETPLPVAGQRAQPLDPEVYRRQAHAALQHGGYEWGAEGGIADELLAITEIGDGFAAQGDSANAAAVYEAVSSEVLQQYEMFHDENGELGDVIRACVEGLGQCLAAESGDGTAREAVLRALFAIYRFDVDFGGVGLSDEVPDLLLEKTTPDERRMVAAWVREALPREIDRGNRFHSQTYGDLLLDLEAETLDDEAFLAVCRETGRTGDLVDRLLELGRVDEAVAETEQADDHTLLSLINIFVQREQYNAAERLMVERAGKTQDARILAWLKDRYKARGNTAAALDLARKIFRMQPSLEEYREIRELAEPRGRWESLRPTLRMFLQESKRDDLLIYIYLDEGEIDHALEAVAAQPVRPYQYWYGRDLSLTVAEAAEATRPRAALELYRKHAEGLIEARGRGNYQQACALLAKVRALYQGLGEDNAWAEYVADLRERNRTLRALREELDAAKL